MNLQIHYWVSWSHRSNLNCSGTLGLFILLANSHFRVKAQLVPKIPGWLNFSLTPRPSLPLRSSLSLCLYCFKAIACWKQKHVLVFEKPKGNGYDYCHKKYCHSLQCKVLGKICAYWHHLCRLRKLKVLSQISSILVSRPIPIIEMIPISLKNIALVLRTEDDGTRIGRRRMMVSKCFDYC